MTGTPIQNSLRDLGSLVKFLDLPLLGSKAEFGKHIGGGRSSALKHSGPNIPNLRKLLGSICLRRSNAILKLVQPKETIFRLDFSVAERLAHDRMILACRDSIQSQLSSERQTRETGQPILTYLLQARRFCNMGFGLPEDNPHARNEMIEEDLLGILQQSGATDCELCHNDLTKLSDVGEQCHFSHCSRVVCGQCATSIREHLRTSDSGTRDCPLCHLPYVGNIFLNLGAPESQIKIDATSSKMKAVVSELKKSLTADKRFSWFHHVASDC